MFNFSEITEEYFAKLVDFLHSISWMFKVLNTQYVRQHVLEENHEFLALLEHVDLNELVNSKELQNNHPSELQRLIENINFFRINFDIINTESWIYNNRQQRMSVKKLYEIENMSQLINEICKDKVTTLVDLGSGLGYLDEYLHITYGYKIIGLEGSEKNQEQAVKRQKKYYADSIGKVKHAHHFITMDSGDFILKQVDEVNGFSTVENSGHTNFSQPAEFALFGLHPCGDLSIVCIELFLNIDRVKKLIFSPCCYHKMSSKDPEYSEFNYYPLSETVKKFQSKYPENPFSRPFLRLAGQQSPIKFKEMTKTDHFVHGKNMFERGVVEAILMENETSKRVNNVIIANGRLKFEDIKLKYQLLDKSTMKPKSWDKKNEDKFNEIRNLHPNGEEMSENLFCLQTTVQNSCENLVIMDRVFYIYEQMKKRNMELKVSIKKLQNEKLSPRCLILIVEKS